MRKRAGFCQWVTATQAVSLARPESLSCWQGQGGRAPRSRKALFRRFQYKAAQKRRKLSAIHPDTRATVGGGTMRANEEKTKRPDGGAGNFDYGRASKPVPNP